MSVRDFLFFLILKVGTHWGTCDGEIKRGYVSEATLHVVAKKNCRGHKMLNEVQQSLSSYVMKQQQNDLSFKCCNMHPMGRNERTCFKFTPPFHICSSSPSLKTVSSNISLLKRSRRIT